MPVDSLPYASRNTPPAKGALTPQQLKRRRLRRIAYLALVLILIIPTPHLTVPPLTLQVVDSTGKPVPIVSARWSGFRRTLDSAGYSPFDSNSQCTIPATYEWQSIAGFALYVAGEFMPHSGRRNGCSAGAELILPEGYTVDHQAMQLTNNSTPGNLLQNSWSTATGEIIMIGPAPSGPSQILYLTLRNPSQYADAGYTIKVILRPRP